VTRPILVMPMHDPAGALFAHLQRILPQLRELCAGAFIGVTAATAAAQPGWTVWLAADDFFRAAVHAPGLPVGDQFRELYAAAATAYPPDAVLHLCFVDRLAFALQTEHRQGFVADFAAATAERTPLLFQRSAQAWATHPAIYRELEGLLTTAGRLLFGQALDFAWCHLVARAGQLREIMPRVRNPDLSMLAEMALLLRGTLRTQEVDWLAWEDPFIEARPADALKRERETSRSELRKRLGYVIPSLQLLWAAEVNSQ
jgi:hypothetical protein